MKFLGLIFSISSDLCRDRELIFYKQSPIDFTSDPTCKSRDSPVCVFTVCQAAQSSDTSGVAEIIPQDSLPFL